MRNPYPGNLFRVGILVSVLATSCASQPPSSIQEVDEPAVAKCEFVGLVSGSSMLGGAIQRTAREHAKADALHEAEARGATHIVWTSVQSTVSNGASAQGKAYRCK